MKTRYQKTIVYDLETGGLKSLFNSITEAAFVVVDMETLEMVDEMDVMILPYLDLSITEEDSAKEAKEIHKMLSVKDEDTGKKMLKYKGQKLEIKNLASLTEDIESFRKNYLGKKTIIDYDELLQIEETEFKDIVSIFFDKCYNPGAFSATGINREMLVKEGIPRQEAFNKIEALFLKHTTGNNKPILSGHNIKKFDNPFTEKFFKMFKKTFSSFHSATQTIDTLEWSWIKWYSMPSYALGVVAQEIGVTLKDAHRAINDTRANAKFFIKMIGHLRGQGTKKSNYKRRKFNMDF